MSLNEARNARSSTPAQNFVTHFAVCSNDRSSTRSPSPPSPTTSSPGEGTISSTSTTRSSSEPARVAEPSVFTGLNTSTVTFENWSTMMLAKLTEMTNASIAEKDKMEYVVAHTGREAFQKLLERFEEMKGKGVAFGSAKPMVMYLAQYYDENIRMIDLRFSSW